MINFLLILLKSGIPIAATSFGLVWWALRRDYIGGARSLKEYEQWTKAENQARKAEKSEYKAAKKRLKQERRKGLSQQSTGTPDIARPPPRKLDPLHNKWIAFGGGFYGVVALFTYALIEIGEIREFFSNFNELFRGELIPMIVNFFIESLKNFITAITWPAFWLRRIHSEQWLWAVGAYAGYWLGTHAAFRLNSHRSDNLDPDHPGT